MLLGIMAAIICLMPKSDPAGELGEAADVVIEIADGNAESREFAVANSAPRSDSQEISTTRPHADANAAPTPDESPTASKDNLMNSIWMGWTFYESGDQDVWVARGDGGHAYGRYQFDDRFLLPEFFRYCVKNERERYEPFTALYYIDDAGQTHLRNTDRIETDWKWMDYLEGENFHEIQTRFAVEEVYLPACTALEEHCGDLGSYSPVLHGTIMSIAIRDGFYLADLRSITETYYDGIPEVEWLQAIYDVEAYIHSDDDYRRWAYRQKSSALDAYDAYRECLDDPEDSTRISAVIDTYQFENYL